METRYWLWASILGAVTLGLMAAAVSAEDVDCSKAYKSALEKIRREAEPRLSPERLAGMRRQALRIYDACETGHVQDPKTMYEKLERSMN